MSSTLADLDDKIRHVISVMYSVFEIISTLDSISKRFSFSDFILIFPLSVLFHLFVKG